MSFKTQIALSLLAGTVLALILFRDPTPHMRDQSKWMQSRAGQVVDATIKEFEAVERQGDPIKTCAQARIVVAAARQANDEARLHAWKTVESKWCRQ